MLGIAQPRKLKRMPNTYTQLFIHVVFAIKGRERVIQKQHRELLQKYITTTLQNDGHKMMAIFCMPDHIHFLVGLNPSVSISDMVLDVKRASTNFINEKKLVAGHFNWQKGFGAFSYSKSQVPDVCKYITSQEEHHRKRTFKEEYVELLRLFEVEFEEKYLFEFVD